MAIDLPRRVLLRTGDEVIRDDASLAPYDATWGTKLRETWLPALRGTGEPDEQWDWFGKADDPCFDAGLEHVVLACDGDLQGTLITSLPQDAPALSLLPAVVYIEYLSSAPWNRGRGGAPVVSSCAPRCCFATPSCGARRWAAEERSGSTRNAIREPWPTTASRSACNVVETTQRRRTGPTSRAMPSGPSAS